LALSPLAITLLRSQ